MSTGRKPNDNLWRLAEMGPMAGWSDFVLERPGGLSMQGKGFLGQRLGLTGIEVSLNAMAPGQSVPFSHAHNRMRSCICSSRARVRCCWTMKSSRSAPVARRESVQRWFVVGATWATFRLPASWSPIIVRARPPPAIHRSEFLSGDGAAFAGPRRFCAGVRDRP